MAAPFSPLPPAVRPTSDISPPQASLRDFLNSRMAPFLKRAIKQSLLDEPDQPLRYLGEHLINQSLQFEGTEQSADIKQHFKYSFDRRPAPSEQVQAAPAEPVAETAEPAEQVPAAVTAPPATNGVDDEVQMNGSGGGEMDQEHESLLRDVEMKEGE